eukprot:CAMPEP_0195521074 /NCGR_PEP_ID=MMETSP0794_2-20130614/17892_1 /TAXON_ID=515487 /ORGANISM="Stephanopyxis turris, Strain CCMP 815" /LENGTH=475 /DNA_ID=CAMNT_0040650541 /DNA_START=55 /DNA_END=1482 /DNA_ORIENTATION=-
MTTTRPRLSRNSPVNNSRLYSEWQASLRARVERSPAYSGGEEDDDGDAERASAERQIDRLPELASLFYEEEFERFGWGPTLREILVGTRDEVSSPLYLLRGMESSLVRRIYSYVAMEWGKHITLTVPASCVGFLDRRERWCRFGSGRHYPGYGKRKIMIDWPIRRGSSDATPNEYMRRQLLELAQNEREAISISKQPISSIKGYLAAERKDSNEVPMDASEEGSLHVSQYQLQGIVAFTVCGTVHFPEPTDRNVNMMPFIFGDISSLPPSLQCYFPLIEQCPYLAEETGKVGFLTVHESWVDAGSAQRRQGLHIESPGVFGDVEDYASFSPAREHPWGCGVFYEPDMYEGGIYFASNVDNTSEVWDALVDKNVEGIVDRHGGCEHLRRFIGPGTKLQANELVWMTDCTPHEALVQETSGYRQFFRVVTSHISHWFANNSTKNSLVSLPDHVVVINENKFKPSDPVTSKRSALKMK